MEKFEYYCKAHKYSKALWLELLRVPASEHARYNIGRYWTFPGEIDIARMQHALQDVVNTNWDMRSNFFEQDGELYLGVHKVVTAKLEYREAANAAACSALIEALTALPFDLERDKLFRFYAIKNIADQQTTLLFIFCHLITDGAVIENIARQAEQAYVEQVQPDADGNDSAGLATLQAFMAAQEQETITDTGISYWADKLAGKTLTNQLPRNSGGKEAGFKVMRADKLIQGEIYRKIKRFCSVHNVSLFNVMQALTGLVVCRYSGSAEAVISYPVNIRGQHKGLKGFCVNALLYLFAEAGTFLEQVQKLRAEIPPPAARKLAAWELSGTVYTKDTHLNVALSHTLGYKFDFAQIGSVSENILIPNVGQSDLAVYYDELPDGLELTVLSVAGSLTTDMLVQIANHFEWLAEKVTGETQEQTDLITLLTAAEYEQIMYEWNKPAKPSVNKTFIDLFRQQVNLHGENIALVDAVSTLTYEQTDLYSDRLARELVRLGVTTNTFVAIMLPRRKEFMISVIAAMKAGGAYVPLDNEYPPERLAYMVKDSSAKVLITTRDIYAQKGIPAANALFIEQFDFSLESNQDIQLAAPDRENLAYMIYTSGSTGKPKGVMIRHKSLVSMLSWRTADYGLTASDKVCCHCSFSFDASVNELFVPLIVGGQLHIISEELRQDLPAFHHYLLNHAITDGAFSTQFGMELINQFDVPLRSITLGGEKLKAVRKVRGMLVNAYGPTEFTVASNYHIVNQEKDFDNIPIGKPVANSWSYVVDKTMKLAPIGVAGELCLAGEQIALGYWNRPDLTAEKFIPNPFQTCPENDKMYRTGDLVRWNANGELEYLGRIDSQIKLRGFRIELGEIESAMDKFPGITASVADVKIIGTAQHLCGYFTAACDIDINELRDHLRQGLTEYMVPTVLLQLDKIPLTPNGKVDKKALPEPVMTRQEIVLPQTETQQQLFTIITTILNANDFGVTDDLFSAGLTSILAIKLSVGIYKQFGVNVKTNDIFTNTTIVQLEQLISKAAQADHAVTFAKQAYYPLTENQLGVYYEWEKDRTALQYNIPQVSIFSRQVDPVALYGAVEKVIAAHPYLKTVLTMRDDQVVQLRNDDAPVIIELTELTEHDIATRKQNFVQPFDLFTGPLYRIAVCYTDKHTYLFVDIHHIIIDGTALSVFMADLAKAYRGEELIPEAYTGFDYALAEAQLAGSVKYAEAEQFFDSKLSGTMTELPRIATGSDDHRTAVATVLIPGQRITSFCQKYAITPSNLFLAALCLTLARYTREEQVVITAISSGRNENRLHAIMGMLVKTLPVVVDIKASDKVTDYVKAVQDTMFATLANEIYPFTKIAKKHKIAPLINYAYQGGVMETVEFAGHPLATEVLALNKAKFPLEISATPVQGDYEFSVEYDTSLYTDDYMTYFTSAIAACANQLAEHPDLLCTAIAIVDDQQQSLLASFNADHEEFAETTWNTLFEKTAQAHSNHTALIAADKTFSYAELNAMANRIANALIAKGIKPEDKAAILLPRDSRLLCALLGIIKSGGAFIPIDPQYPADRVNHILADSGAAFIITTGETQAAQAFPNGLIIDELLRHEADHNPETAVTAANLCYIIYTSGSTGKPKGVLIEHRNIVNYVLPLESNFYIKKYCSCRVSLSITTVSFDVFVEEALVTLANGLTLAFADEDTARNPLLLGKFMTATAAEVIAITPSLILQYLEDEDFANALATVKVIICGGEKFPVNCFSTLRKYTDAVIFNCYGPTETTIGSNAKEMESETITVGKGLGNVKLYIVDKGLNLLPIGAVGELLIGGYGVGRGYLNRPDLTQEMFITFQGERVYRSGDYAKWTPDGEIDIISRMDDQIKLRGLRIELGEIENTLQAYDGISLAVVIVRQNQGIQYLVGYYTAQTPDTTIDLQKLTDYLRRKLPDYMVPAYLIRLEAMPLTTSGKIDRKKLPAVEFAAPEREYIAPSSTLEEKLCAIWAATLRLDKVGVTDDFFNLGGDSIQSIQLSSRMRKAGITASVKDIFAYRTISRLAKMITTEASGSDILSEQGPLSGDIACLPIQQWFLTSDFANKNYYNQSFLIRVNGKIDQEKLESALEKLNHHHDILRAAYPGGKQVYRPTSQVIPVREWDITGKTTAETQAALTGWQNNFNLEQGYVWQSGIIRGYHDGSERIYFAAHHMVIDAVSWRILCEDLRDLYEGRQLSAKGTSYRQWVENIQEYDSHAPAAEQDYWAAIYCLQAKQQNHWQQLIDEDGISRSTTVEFSEEITRRLLQSSNNAYNTEINDLLLSGLAQALFAVSGEQRSWITLEGHGREDIADRIDISRTVGWFTTMYPVQLTWEQSLRATIISNKENSRQIPRKGIGYGALHGYGRLPKILFNYLGQIGGNAQGNWELTGEASGLPISPDNKEDSIISINGLTADGKMRFIVESCLNETAHNQLSARFTQSIADIVAFCEEIISQGRQEKTASDYPEAQISQEHYEQLQLRYGNNIASIYPANSLQEGFIYHVAAHPDDDAYRLQTVYDYNTNLHVEHYKQAWKNAVAKYPVLRTRFDWEDNMLQIVLAAGEPEIYEYDLTTEADQETAIRKIQESDRQRAYDLRHGSLVRIHIIRRGDETYTILESEHHAITDGWSTPILLDYIHHEYYRLNDGIDTDQSAETAYEEAQKYYFRNRFSAAEYWQQTLAGITDGNDISHWLDKKPKRLDLNAIRSITDPQEQTIAISGPDYEKLKAVAKDCGVTVNVLLQYAWHKLLHVYTRDEVTTVGTTVSGRGIPVDGIEASVGMYINTLPLTVRWHDKTLSLQAKLAEIQNQINGLNTNCHVRLAGLQTGGKRLFHNLFAYENYPAPDETAAEAARPDRLKLNIRYGVEKVDYPLGVMAIEQDNALHIAIKYGGQLSSSETIGRLLEKIKFILLQLPDNISWPESAIQTVDCNERKLLEQFNQPSKDIQYDNQATFPDLFRRQVKLHGENIALVDSVSNLTYEQTDLHSDRLARELMRLGVTANTFVGIMLPRRKEFMVSVIAILKACGAYVPLDNEYPQDRIAYMLQDSGAKVLITTKELYAEKGVPAENVLYIDQFDFNADSDQDIHLATPDRESLAYMIYTSGSTGKPKGVMIRHKSLVAFLAWRAAHYGLTAADKVCCHSSFSFDASVYDLFVPLIVGGQLHIISEDLRHDMPAFHKYLTTHEITDGAFSTQFGMELINQFNIPLRSITLGGEKLKVVKKFHGTLVNGYGPTEFTIASNYHIVDQEKGFDNIPIGKPVPNSWSYVVDESMNLVPIGVAGELCLAGEQIALGYWNRADLTAEKFIANPFKTCLANDKMYRTGDLVKWNANGELEYLGRIDNQIKLRGFRIELGEIESAMTKFPGITASAADVKTIGTAQHLYGYFTAVSEINIDELRDYLRQGLTEYMVPTMLLQLDKIPLTPNGKVDKKALPEPELKNMNTYVAPTNELEAKLCQIFAETLQLDQAGITDSFFDLGGTSLLVMKVVVKAMAMDINITYGNVFECQTPQKLAEFVSSQVKESSFIDISDYDYTAIDKLLAKNALGEITEKPLGDILLTGATGFLGIHVLREFIEHYPGKVYCLMRSQDGHSADMRLKVRLVYYFDHDYADLFGSRIFTIEGDITALESMTAKVDTVINCAAIVKHFTVGDELEKANVAGVRNLIQYCQNHDALLIQVSTISVAGTGDAVLKEHKVTEAQLYVGQHVDNQYVQSKFVAERYVLEAASKGLQAKIMRVGNLTARNQDGEFQLNFQENSFMNSLKSYKLLGAFPVTSMGQPTEFSPIDSTAKAVLKLAQSNSEYTVFHAHNNHPIYMADIIYAMKDYGFPIAVVNEEQFAECLREKMQDETIMQALTGILAYQENDPDKPIYPLGISNQFTTEVLYRLNFVWPVTSEFYIKKAVEALDSLGFFEC